MPKETLRQSLKRLHVELESRQELDPELVELLEEVAEDIEHVLADEHERPHSIKERIEEVTVRFEADYPRLSRVLGEVTDALTKLGL